LATEPAAGCLASQRLRVWWYRSTFPQGLRVVADALFVALAERIGEPRVTKDRGFASSARRFAGIRVIELSAVP
jgi:predicted nucleic acid-binding protein